MIYNNAAKISTLASVSNAAGATKTGKAIVLSNLNRPTMFVKLLNGGTAPSAPAIVEVQVKTGGTWTTVKKVKGSTDANGEVLDTTTLPPATQARVLVNGNTGQAVTVEAHVFAHTGA